MSSIINQCNIHNLDIELFCCKEKILLCKECSLDHIPHAYHFFKIPRVLTKSYIIIDFLGSGASGKVFKIKSKLKEFIQAAKIMSIPVIETTSSQLDKTEAINEINIISKLNNEYILNSTESFFEEDKENHYYIILMDYCEFNLRNYLTRNLIIHEKLKLIKEIAYGVQYLHSKNIIHRDLKQENIFLIKNKGNKYTSKIGDFGISILVKTGDRTTAKHGQWGTELYMSPEALLGDSFNRKTDVWACGIIFYEILFGIHPFQIDKNERSSRIGSDSIIERIKNNQPFFAKEFKNSPFKNLIEKCLSIDKYSRFSADQMVTEITQIQNEIGEFIEENNKIEEENNIENSKLKQKNNESETKFKEKILLDNNQVYINNIDYNQKTSISKKEVVTSQLKQKLLEDSITESNVQNKNKKIFSLKSGDNIPNNSQTISELEIIQSDFTPDFKILIQNKLLFNHLLNNLSSFNNLTELTLKIVQNTYNSDFIEKMSNQLKDLSQLKYLDLAINNSIVFIEVETNSCLCYWILTLFTFGFLLLCGKRSPCACKGFFTSYDDGRKFKIQEDNLINDSELKIIANTIKSLKRLTFLKLDISFNNVTSNGILYNFSSIKKDLPMLKNFEIKMYPQLSDQNPETIHDFKINIAQNYPNLNFKMDF